MEAAQVRSLAVSYTRPESALDGPVGVVLIKLKVTNRADGTNVISE